VRFIVNLHHAKPTWLQRGANKKRKRGDCAGDFSINCENRATPPSTQPRRYLIMVAVFLLFVFTKAYAIKE
jgi:hypothetical protein